MAVNILKRQPARSHDVSPLAGMIFMGLTVLVTVTILLLNSNDVAESFPYIYLLPWILALAVVLALPTAYLAYRHELSFDNPLLFATVSFFFPACVLGGLSLAVGWSQPYYLSFIQDQTINLPFTIVIIMLGFAGLAVGYFMPFARNAGAKIAQYLPSRVENTNAAIIPGLFLLFLGMFNSIIAFLLGFIGYQVVTETSAFDGLIFITTFFWVQANFILWYILFKRRRLDLVAVVLGVIVIATSLGKALLAGNRGGLVTIFIGVILAYIMCGREFRFKQAAFGGVGAVILVIVGMVYGTTFRTVKGTEANLGAEQYVTSIADTFSEIGNGKSNETLDLTLSTIGERIDAVSPLAVVVSNYEQLAPYEESYGLDNNIWKDTISFFIPRVVWEDKPLASQPRQFADLYFSYGDNSFVITPMGDLLRNFGVYGVFFGMFVMGVVLRFVYRALVEGQTPVLWKASLYFMLLTSISYENFYGALLPYASKVGLTAVVGAIIVDFLAGRFARTERSPIAVG